VEGVEGQCDSGQREHRESEVVDADPAEDVAETAEEHHHDGGHHEVAHQHPEQVAHVARGERVQADTPEDGRQ
jgi:hypothetical protein